MPAAIISDTSCFIILDKIDELDLLRKLYRIVLTTPEVISEFGSALPSWVEVKEPTDKSYLDTFGKLIDKGEASAIALALEQDDSLLIIDEYKGRKIASKLGLTITGTFGVIVDAKFEGHILSVKPIFDKIRETNFRVSKELERLLLAKAGES